MAGMNEASIYEAMGLPVPEEGVNGQDIADPAAQSQNDGNDPETGANGQDIADPAEDNSDPNSIEDPSEGDDGQETQTLTVEQRRANAARRRQQEEQARTDRAVQAAVAAEQEKQAAVLKDLFARAGLKNTVTGAPITTMEEFNTYHQQFAREKLRKDLQAGNLTPESLEMAISEHPLMKQAAEVIRQSAAEKKQQEDAAARARIDAQIAEIHKLDPSISTVQDLLKMPNAKEFYDYAKKGLDLKDAYYLANRERLEKETAAAASQRALNNSRGKDHLRATGNARGSGAASVPAEDMAMFRLFNPNATEAEIQAYYNNHQKH